MPETPAPQTDAPVTPTGKQLSWVRTEHPHADPNVPFLLIEELFVLKSVTNLHSGIGQGPRLQKIGVLR